MTNFEITNAYVGDTQAEKIYLGTDVIYSTYIYCEENDGKKHFFRKLEQDKAYMAGFDMPINNTITLYINGIVFTADTIFYSVAQLCDGYSKVVERQYLYNTPVENMCIACNYPTDNGKKQIYMFYLPETNEVRFETYYNNCSGSTSSHTASVLLDGSVDIDLPETLGGMYEMAFSEPYTSLTLYYDDEVVTASTLTISVDGSQSTTETDFEVADINTDIYGGSSINTISFNADSYDVYIDIAP